nr:uncharacterized protein LOC128705368 [Cherax quadricarinatus]
MMSSILASKSPVTEVFPTEGSVDHSTLYDPLLEEDYPSLENNKIPPLSPKDSTNPNNIVPHGGGEDGDMPNEILLGTLGREPSKDVGIAYAEGGITGKPSPQYLTGRSWDDIT